MIDRELMGTSNGTQQKGVRVALLGNMNNNHFAMARFLRDRGVDADLLLFDHEFEHFHPSADTYELTYRHYTRQLSWGSSTRFLATSRTRVREDLAPYDVLIGCGFAPAYCEKAGRTMDIFVPYGADIWTETAFRFISPQKLPSYWAAVFYQRRGIRRSAVIHMALSNEMYERQYARYKGRSERWLEGIPMVHSPTYAPEELAAFADRTHWAGEFRALRQQNDLMVVYHARHYWTCSATDANAKGTDKLLRGWALFRKNHPDLRAVLVTLEYGKDVTQSKALIDELGISHSVAWLPRMLRKDIMVGLNLADIICGEFENSWATSGVLYEALALGKPILAWRDDAYHRAREASLYPILNANTPEEIAGRLEEFLSDPEMCRRAGRQGRQWYEEHVVNQAIGRYLAFFRDRSARACARAVDSEKSLNAKQ